MNPYSRSNRAKRKYAIKPTDTERDKGAKHISLHHECPTLHNEEYEQEARMQWLGKDPRFRYGPNHHRGASAIEHNVREAVRIVGLERILFLTLTFRRFPPNVYPFGHANQCFFAAKRLFNDMFHSWLRVLDVHQSGIPHFHVIAVTHQPILERYNTDAYDILRATEEAARLGKRPRLTIAETRELRDTVSTNPHLRAIWHRLDSELPGYGFGALSGAYPLRRPPAHVAHYLLQSYNTAIPFIKRQPIRIHAYASSPSFPSRVPASAMVSPKWQAAADHFARAFGFDDRLGLRQLSLHWSYRMRPMLQALDGFLVNPRDDIPIWQDHPPGPWLIDIARFMIQHDDLLYRLWEDSIPQFDAQLVGYQRAPEEPRIVEWNPAEPRPCECCSDGRRHPCLYP